MKLVVTRMPAMSVTPARIASNVGSTPLRATLSTMLSAVFTRLDTCSIGL